MDIYELDSYRLSDAVKFHTELNPALWDGDQLRPEVRDALLKIAEDFKTFMGISDLALDDITISGSNAAFSYTPHSDIDLHLIVDFSKLNPDEVYQELFNAKKYQYNDQHDIKIRGYDVELYVQDAGKPVRSLGEYSIVRDDWIRIPVRRRGNLDEKSTKAKYEKLRDLIELALQSDDLDAVTHVTDTLKKYRQAGLDEHGEFGPENLAYKILRTQGYVERLFNHKNDLKDATLSLSERKKKKKKKEFRYGAFGGMFFPGYHYYGQTDAATDGGSDDIEESVESTVKVKAKEIPLEKVVRHFVHFAQRQLGLKKLPRIVLRGEEFGKHIHSFGHYVDDKKMIEVETHGRHVMDVLRTLAHELVHYRQHQQLGGEMPASAGRTGSPYENEAHAEAGVVMRHFQNKYPEFFGAETVAEAREGTMREVIRKMLPGWPDYVIKDWISSRVKDQTDLNNLKGWLGELNKQVVPNSWQLHQRMPLTFDMLAPKTRYFMKTKRQFGERNPFMIPRDRERLENAIKLVQEKGMENLPPVIMLQHANGLELCEGWHRTIAAFRLHPEGFQINAWIAKANDTVAEDGDSVAAQYGDQTPPGPESKPTMPRGTVRVDVSDVYDWYKLGQHISNMKGLGHHDFGKGPPSSIVSFGSEDEEHKFIKDLEATGLDVTDIDPQDPKKPQGMRKIKTDPTYNVDEGWKEKAAAAALAGGMALGTGTPAQAQDAGNIAYQVGKQIYQPSGIFTRAGAEEELKGIARDLARGIRTGQPVQNRFFGKRQQEERTSAIGIAPTPEAAYEQALQKAYEQAYQQFGGSTKTWRVVDNQGQSDGKNYHVNVVLQGPAAVKENASGYIPTKKQARDPRFKTALTVDIKPGQVGKEANKLGLKTDSQGRPDLLMKNLANALKEFKETGIFEAVKPVTPVPHGRAPKTEYPPMVKQKTSLPQGKPRPRPDGTGKIIDYEIREDEDLLEVKMSPSSLEAWARSPEADGIRAGFEAEMIFRNTKRDEDEEDMEPDYDYDERPDDIDHVIDFFSHDDYGYGLSPRGARNLRENLWEEYNEWVDEQISESWDNEAEDQVRDYMEIHVWGDDSEREDRIRAKVEDMFPDDDADAIMAAGDAAPRFTKVSDQQEYVKEHELYQKYLDASDEAHEDFEQEALNEYESQGEYYDSAREYYSDMMREGGDYDESDFLRDRYGYMSEISNSHSLDWPYWTGGSSGGGDREWSDIASDLESVVDMEVKVGSGYHSTTRKEGRWIIEPDGSLDPDDSDDMGLEIVSPPMPLPEALEKLQKVIEWGNSDADAYTNRSTGLHMGVSIPYVGGDVDYVKLVLFMGDQYVLDKFERAGNTYCASAMEKLRQNISGARNRGELTEAKLDPMGALELVKKNLIELAARYVQNGVGNSKYTSAHIKDGYIEFRSPGGDYLAMDSRGEYDDIRNTMLRFARAMQIAGSPSLERREYAKKLYKLISPGAQNDGLKLFADFVAGTITPEQLKKQWADAVLQKEIPTTGKEEYEVYDTNNKNSPDGVIDTFYARDYDSAYDQYSNKYKNDPRWSHTDVRSKQPWFDVKDSYGDVILTIRARDIDQANQKVQAEYGDRLSDDWEVFRRPDNTPEPEKKLSRRAEIAKRLKQEPIMWRVEFGEKGLFGDKVLYIKARSEQEAKDKAEQQDDYFGGSRKAYVKPKPATREEIQAWERQQADNKQDTKDIQARIGEPRPAGAVGSSQRYRVTWNERRGDRVVSDALNIDAPNATAAMDRVRDALQLQGRDIIQISADVQEPAINRNALSQTDIENRLGWGGQEADANYEVIDRQTMQPVFKFIANTPDEAARKYTQVMDVMMLPHDTENYGWRSIGQAVPGSTVDLQRQRAAQSSGEFSGRWQVRNANTGEVVYTFSGVGNNQGDANRVAQQWVQRTRFDDPVEVIPEIM